MTITYTLEKRVFADAPFMGRFLSDKVRKRVIYFGLFVSFYISRGKMIK